MGQSEHGIPLTVNRLAAAADLLLATGVVEPHQYAGFSGGSKTVAVGVAGEPTIAYTHGPAMLDQAGVRLGNLHDNPFQAAVREAVAGPDYALCSTWPSRTTASPGRWPPAPPMPFTITWARRRSAPAESR